LLVVGGIDGDEIPKNVHAFASATPNIVQAGWLPDTSPMYQVMDALVLPTHREGFPNVCLEAGAAARPIITTMATGAIDAIVPGETGLIVPVADVDELTRAMTSLARDPDGAERMGQRGLEFVSRNFSNKIVWANLLDFISVRDPSHRLVEPAGRDLQP
jgi:glycosyltransferase involved in cell wall biosynthesis